MKTYFHEFQSTIPIYDGDFSLIITNDVEQCKARFKGDFEKDGYVYAHALTRTESVGKGYETTRCLIVLNPDYFTPLYHGSIAHEASHITNWVMEINGIKWDANNDEPQNYLLLYFVNLIYSHLSDLKMLHRIKIKR